jgi:ElaB/YqjD/DUF883 family membrane-anchored ribosome-binding protein
MPAEPLYREDETRSPAPEPVTPPIERIELEAPPRSAALQETAQTIGGAVGKAVETVQHLPERLQEMKERFTVISGRAQKDTMSKASELKEQAAEKVSEARSRADRLARQYPLQTIAVMAGIGLLLGIVLRIWRDHAD